MKTLVLGGTGTVGSQVVKELLARKVDVKVLTRNSEKAASLPAGATGIVGDLLEPATVRSVFDGIDGVFMLNALGTAETHEGLMALSGARAAGVKRFVYMSVHDLHKAYHLPHFGSKMAIEQVLKESGMEYSIIRPNNFYQNDHWFKDAILQYGVYPQPIGSVGLSRVDVRDIAEAAAITLTADGHSGRVIDLVGPEVVTGPGTADAWSEALGRKIVYGGDNLDAWEQASLQYLPAFLAYDFRMMYAFFQEKGLRATSEAIEIQAKLLGHPPRRFADFARETAAAWK